MAAPNWRTLGIVPDPCTEEQTRQNWERVRQLLMNAPTGFDPTLVNGYSATETKLLGIEDGDLKFFSTTEC
jgi:hypothetical protein